MMTRICSGFTFKAMAGLSLAWLGLAGCSQDVEDIRAEGIEQYHNRQYIESMATLRYGLSIEPSDAQSNYYMAMNYRALAAARFRDGDIPAAERNLDTAIMYYNQAIKSWPNYQAAVAGKTEALELRGRYLKALDEADAVAYNNRGGAAEHYIYAGDKYRDNGDFDSALQRYKLALSTDPKNARAYASIGRMYVLAGDQAKAMDAYAKARELDPNNAEVNEALASLTSGSGDAPEPGTGPESGSGSEPGTGTGVTQNPNPPPSEQPRQ